MGHDVVITLNDCKETFNKTATGSVKTPCKVIASSLKNDCSLLKLLIVLVTHKNWP